MKLEILLEEDFKYIADSFWKNENVGESRVNMFIGFITFVLGGLAALISSDKTTLYPEQIQLIVFASLFALITLGTITLLRIITRNELADKFKKQLDYIRSKCLKEREVYDPFAIYSDADKKFKFRKFGGLVHTVAAINSFLIAMFSVAWCYPANNYEFILDTSSRNNLIGIFIASFIVIFVVQIIFIFSQEKKIKELLNTK